MNQTTNPMRITFPSDKEYHVIGRIDGDKMSRSILVVMKKISERDYTKLRNEEAINVDYKESKLPIDASNCYAYGPIDITSEEDLNIIKKFKWCSNRFAANFVPRNYDYETNTGDAYINYEGNRAIATVECSNNVEMFKYAHACLGKPKLVVVYGINIAKHVFGFR